MKKLFNSLKKQTAFALVAVLALGTMSANAQENDKTILGAGATFPYPLYSKQFSEYNKATGIQVNYQSIGSGGGILQLTNKTVDFGASDAPMNDDQTKKIGAEVLHIPQVSGAVVLIYNLPGIKANLNFTPDVLADIFLGKITKWNDPRIASINKGVSVPAFPIMVAHRSDGSGTTNIFTNYLSKVSSEWATKVGASSAVNWPAGLGGKGNEGVSGLVKQTPGAIGYVELIYALQNKMSYGIVKNKSGKFITPSLASVTAASKVTLPADAKILLTNTDAKDGYPISGFTWIIIYKEQNYNGRTLAQAQKLTKFLWWNLHEGQKYAEALNYAPLAPAALKIAEKILKSATYNNKPIK